MTTTQNRRATFPGDRRVDLSSATVPEPGLGQVRIALEASGVCGSDLHYLYRVPAAERGQPRLGVSINADAVPGHESAGRVTAIGDGVRGLAPGDRVVVHHIAGCGHCDWCVQDKPMHCAEKQTYGFDIDGGFQEHMIADAKDCVPVPDGLSMTAASFLACGAGTAFNAVRKLDVGPRDRFVVVGLGPVGLAAVLFGLASGAEVAALDVSEERRALAADLGAQLVVNPRDDDATDVVDAWTGGRGASAGIDCSGNGAARRNLVDLVGVGGRVAFVGEGGEVTLDVSQQIIHKQLTIIGSWIFGRHELRQALEFVADRGTPIDRLVTNTFPLVEAQQALDLADSGAGGKVVITMQGGTE